MKRIKIYPHKIGLVFRKDNFVQVIDAGTHWVRFTDKVIVYDRTRNFVPPCDLSILLANPGFTYSVELVEVQDHEIALHYRDANFDQVLGPGRYAFWKSVARHEFRIVNLNQIEVPPDIDRNVLRQNRDLLDYCSIFTVESFEEALLFVDGEFQEKLAAGTYYYWKSRRALSLKKADQRQQQLEISGQEILSRDRAALRINFYAHYRITHAEKALIASKDYDKQLYMLLQLALREYVGTKTLDELLANKENVRSFIFESVSNSIIELGCELISCGIRDIILPGEVRDIMNRVLIAEKQAQANIITRRQETASTRSLLNTAKLMEDNEMLFRLKEMEYVEKIAEKINNITLSGGSQVVDQLREIFTKK